MRGLWKTDMACVMACASSLRMRYARTVEELTGKRDRKALLYSLVPDCLIPFFVRIDMKCHQIVFHRFKGLKNKS